MNYIVVECEQKSPEWIAARIGKLTGSRAPDAFARNKPTAKQQREGEPGEWSRDRAQTRTKVVLERVTQMSADDPYRTYDMKRGEGLEATGLMRYEAVTGRFVMRSGFLQHPTLAAGVSLDGHVGRMEGIVEIKCPRPTNHYDNLRAPGIPAEYLDQVRMGLWITGADWVDFASFCPQFPVSLQLSIRRLTREAADLARYERDVRAFLDECDAEEQAIRTMADTAGVLRAAAEQRGVIVDAPDGKLVDVSAALAAGDLITMVGPAGGGGNRYGAS